MFERYTESARRTIFFARYEAAHAGSANIGAVHLLSGLLREDTALFRALLGKDAPIAELRRELHPLLEPTDESVETSVDLPLSPDTKRALHEAMKEADRMNQRAITCAHLLIGLLLAPSSPAAQLLAKFGVELEKVRGQAAARREVAEESGQTGPADWTFTGKTQTAMGMARAGSQHSTYRFENEEMVVETDRAYFGNHILLTERIRFSEDGRTLHYRLRLKGPGGKTGEYDIDFDLPAES